MASLATFATASYAASIPDPQDASSAQAAPAAPPAAAPAAAPAPAPAPVWSVGTIDFSGYVDGYVSYNANRPSNVDGAAVPQASNLYNFDDKTDQFNLEAAKLTLNHDPDPIGAHVDLLFGRTNTIIHSGSDTTNENYIEQAYITMKPPKAKGFELDFGQFVTSAGQEVIETMSNWSYSHGLLFSYAIPYYHFGLRTSLPATKTWTVGVQLVNGWNDVNNNNGGVTVGLTSSVVKTKYTWNTNFYSGPSNNDTQKGYRNLIDTTLLLTPNAKFNYYVNYDYGQNHIPAGNTLPVIVAGENPVLATKTQSPHWQGLAASARAQVTANAALIGRYEYFYDDQGYQTGLTAGHELALNEFTATYEYKWAAGLLMRTEFRRDSADRAVFNKGNTGTVKAQSTATVGLIAFFGPKR